MHMHVQIIAVRHHLFTSDRHGACATQLKTRTKKRLLKESLASNADARP